MDGPNITGAAPETPWPENPAAWVDNGYEARWEAAATAAAWNKRDRSGYIDWYKRLNCPRCDHPISVLVGPGAYRDAPDAGGAPAAEVGYVAFPCNCSAAHTGRPEKVLQGCGYAARILGPTKRDGAG